MNKILSALLAFGLTSATTSFAQELPSSQVETYKDWTLRCVPVEGKQTCQMMQELSSKQSGQRVLAFVIDKQAGRAPVTGTLILPFGLELDAGINAKIDEQTAFERLAFSTCVPAGCLAPVELSDALTEQLKTGQNLTLTLKSISSQQPVSIELSLSGFSAALARLNALSNPS
ncbi:invasion associated locus B family protein [Pseudovibrio sp. POLY-S9]|uniref:invasion associated locus B family protein n=1 Tax=Pseudovibrio sp. POLY-S9 TaxID=1576596 RepID=UPI00070C0BFF|nr:invasion associated locus B family protein [Pseudovibrio sp. POLY-S9]